MRWYAATLLLLLAGSAAYAQPAAQPAAPRAGTTPVTAPLTVPFAYVETLAAANSSTTEKLLERRKDRAIGLVTGLDLPDYLAKLRVWGITRVLTKTEPVDPFEVRHFLDMMSDPSSGFGLISYLESTIQMFNISIDSIEAKTKGIERVIKHFQVNGYEEGNLYDVRLILEELINNALFHAFRNAVGEEKYWVNDFVRLAPEESVRVEYGSDKRYIGFSVTDSAGQLPIDVIIGKLERQYSQEGIFDESGRGIYLTRMLASRLVVNLEKDSRTQFIVLFSPHRSAHEIKPFVINYVGEDNFDEWRSDPDLD